jgi:uncharacterized protein YfiM (DUF2279 family)
MSVNEEKRNAWEAKMTSKLKALDAEIEKLKARTHESTGDAQNELRDKLESLKARRDDAKGKWEKLQAAGEDAWDQVQEGSESLWEDISSAVAGASDALRKHK